MQQLSYSGVKSASMCRRCVPPTARTALEARIVSVCASYAQFSLLAMKKDGRKGSANPSRYGKDNGICRLDLPFADLRMGDGAA